MPSLVEIVMVQKEKLDMSQLYDNDELRTVIDHKSQCDIRFGEERVENNMSVPIGNQ